MSRKKGEAFVVDGINVCFWWGQVHKHPSTHKDGISIRPLLLLLTEIRNHGDDFFCIFDASIERAIQTRGTPEEWTVLNTLLEKHRNRFIQVTGGTQADPVILHVSERSGSRIISNDRYKEFKDRFPWLEEKHGTRFLRGNFLPDGSLTVPNLDYGFLFVDSRKTTNAMATALEPLLAGGPLAPKSTERNPAASLSRKQVKAPTQTAIRRSKSNAQTIPESLTEKHRVQTPRKKVPPSKKTGLRKESDHKTGHSTTTRRVQVRSPHKQPAAVRAHDFQEAPKEMSLRKKVGIGAGLTALAVLAGLALGYIEDAPFRT